MSEIFRQIAAPLPLAVVLFGALLIALAQQGLAALPAALRALGPLLAADPDRDRDAARAVLLRAEEVTQVHGLARADRLRAAHPFMTGALATLANAPDVDRFSFWAQAAIADRQARHARAIGFWNAMADAAPAMGMAGTIVGLIGMFARMSDPASIGPAMALALMTTLDGMILANAIAGPIANRLAWLSAREIAWQEEVAGRMAAIARRESATLPKVIAGMREVA